MAGKQARSTRKLQPKHRAGKAKNGGAGAFSEGPVKFVTMTKRQANALRRHLRYTGDMEYGN